MTPNDVGAVAGCLCGLLMVVGGMFLLYTGAISLKETSKEEAVSLEFKRLFHLTTHYPALGLFVIGLAFIVTSVVLSRPRDNRITMSGLLTVPAGTTDLDPQDLRLSLESSLKPQFDSGTNSITVDGDPTTMWQVVITYPGMFAAKPVQVLGRRNIPLGSIALVRVAEKPPVNPANIASLPTTIAKGEGGL